MSQSEIYHKILPNPERPGHLSVNSKWLSGEGCGSWFNIEKVESRFLISRYSPDGKLECSGIFQQVIGETINLNSGYDFTYLSHCAEVNIVQNENNLKFKLISKNI
ncbi:MAG: hypothetical protein JSU07_01240 [Bacteroidetes bacterium]|nr:hypothetical protein [Bacteroidota bacterium]